MVRIYIEGSCNGHESIIRCRAGFSKFLQKAGFPKKSRIILCGSRSKAYEKFCLALEDDREKPLLLVDSEGPVKSTSAWEHLKNRRGDKWNKPIQAADDQCHLMVQCMETWLLSDPDALAKYFGKDFHRNKLPVMSNLEAEAKNSAINKLKDATKDTKTQYSKGEISFELLGRIDPGKVFKFSWAAKFQAALKKYCP